jgi:hypothetical protein
MTSIIAPARMGRRAWVHARFFCPWVTHERIQATALANRGVIGCLVRIDGHWFRLSRIRASQRIADPPNPEDRRGRGLFRSVALGHIPPVVGLSSGGT